ncbi:putative serine/threonine-protein kinase iks1 [Physocladia obscura]|uniref:non-specific serine/threonine protein kinase n=1 Tax=Physocladia obscura TaxID=109957 RepID=A0AAD5T2R8_9FUNG|nr:putative serine/threonine-protein kinase iks1 [Physocladia obscura]
MQDKNEWQIVLHRRAGVTASGGIETVAGSGGGADESKVVVLYSREQSRAVVHVVRNNNSNNNNVGGSASNNNVNGAEKSGANSDIEDTDSNENAHDSLITCPECGYHFHTNFNRKFAPNASSNSGTRSNPAMFYGSRYSAAAHQERSDYFRILQLCFKPDQENYSNALKDTSSPIISAYSSSDLFSSAPPHSPADPNVDSGPIKGSSNSNTNTLSESCFNQGYYDRFFVEIKKLGRGLRGSVFLVQHVLDTVFLGEYAVKSIPVGASHSWLVRQLQEVHLLERLRHPNIIHYKHAWIENKQLSFFGPEVPCLFILMELANGGNLEEFIYLQHFPDPFLDANTASTDINDHQRSLRVKFLRKRQQQARQKASVNDAESLHARMYGGIGANSEGRRVRYLTTKQIWALFLDIVEGLAHLHRHGIIHRDLKPPNLLLQFQNPKDPDEIPRILISDFGECEVIGEKVQRAETAANRRTGATGTLEFMCPELLERDEVTGKYRHDHSVKGDMFSLGVVLYFLCYSNVPYSQIDDIDLLKEEILKFDGVKFPIGNGHERRVPQELQRLIQKLLSRDPEKRPSIEEIAKYYRSSPPSFEDDAGIIGSSSQNLSLGGGNFVDGELPLKHLKGLSFYE